MVLSVSKSAQKRLARAVKKSERDRGSPPNLPTTLKATSDEILVILSEDLEDEGHAKAKLRYFHNDAWLTDPVEFEVYAWKFLGGTLDAGKEGWCISYGGRWWMRIPEICPG